MKKFAVILFSITLSLAWNSELQAQTFKPGLIAGINTSQVGGDNYSGFNKLGLTFGGFVRYRLNENWSTQFELAYVQKGSRNGFSISESDPNQVSEYFLMRLNYIEIPVLVNFTFRNFVYEIGLYYGQMIGFYMEYRNDFGKQSGPYESLDDFNSTIERNVPNGAQVRDWDFGGMIGLGYKLSDNMLGSIRWSNSIIPFKDNDSGAIDAYPTSLNLGWTNTVVLGTLRYTFGKGDQEVFEDPNKRQ